MFGGISIVEVGVKAVGVADGIGGYFSVRSVGHGEILNGRESARVKVTGTLRHVVVLIGTTRDS